MPTLIDLYSLNLTNPSTYTISGDTFTFQNSTHFFRCKDQVKCVEVMLEVIRIQTTPPSFYFSDSINYSTGSLLFMTRAVVQSEIGFETNKFVFNKFSFAYSTNGTAAKCHGVDTIDCAQWFKAL